jgi:hypothetical protein
MVRATTNTQDRVLACDHGRLDWVGTILYTRIEKQLHRDENAFLWGKHDDRFLGKSLMPRNIAGLIS